VDREQVVDHRGVQLDGGGGQQVGLERLLAQAGEVVQPVEHVLDLVGRSAGDAGQEVVGVGPHLADDAVHLLHLLAHRGQDAGGTVPGDEPGHPRALSGDHVREFADLRGELGELVGAREIGCRAGGGEHLKATEQHGRGRWDENERDKSRSHTPVTQPPVAFLWRPLS
jgi:hypothetical protein